MKSGVQTIWLFGFLTMFHMQVKAQTDGVCAEQLELAREQFQYGDVYQVEPSLKKCLGEGFSKQQKVDAYKLITSARLYLREEEKAEESYLKLLSISPLYQTNPEVDPYTLVYFSDRFTTEPFYSFFVIAGLNTSFQQTIIDYRLDGDPFSNERKIVNSGFQIGGGYEQNINPSLSVGGRLLFVNRVFSTESEQFTYFEAPPPSDINGNDVIITLSTRETTQWFEIPLYAKYKWDQIPFRPFVRGGAYVNYLINSNLLLEQVITNQATETSPDISLNNVRRKLQYGITLAVGTKFLINDRHFLGLELEYVQGLSNMTNPARRYDGISQTATFGYVSDDFRLSSVQVNLFYELPKYFPRRKK